MTVDISAATVADLFSSSGEMGSHLKQIDWHKTAFGPVSQWPLSLQTSVRICVNANSPMAVWWCVGEASLEKGPEKSPEKNSKKGLEKNYLAKSGTDTGLEVICNDAYHINMGIVSLQPKRALPQVSSHQTSIEPAIRAVLRTGETVHREHKTSACDGDIRVFSLSYSPLFDEAGLVSGVFSSAIETTAQKRVETIQNQMQVEAHQCEVKIERTIEQSTEKAQLQIRNVLESISDAFIALDKDWCYTYVNKKAAQLLHQDGEALVGQPVWKNAFPGKVGTLAYKELYRAMKDNVPVVFEDHSPSFDAWFEVHGYPSSEGLAIYFQDVSDRKKEEAARSQRLAEEQAAREAAEAASRLKDEFLAVVSHELRSPLNPILGCAKLLRKGELTPERREQALRSIERNAQIQAQLVNDLLDVSRILRGELSINICEVPVASAIQATIQKLDLEALSKDISIETAFSAQATSVLVDPGRFQQIIWNLLSNAIKFTSRSGKVVVRTDRVNDQVKISIADTGKGINSSFLPYVFDRFRQEDAATTRRFGGLGLGLSIVRHLVEMHSGAVAASSPGEDQGATFTIFLPLGDLPEKTASNGRNKQALNQTAHSVDRVPARH